MGMIWYLYKKNLKNRAKKAVKKPITYLYVFLILFYIFVMPFSINIMLEEFGWKSVDKLVAIFAIVAFWMIPGNLISYALQKVCFAHFLTNVFVYFFLNSSLNKLCYFC